VYIPLGGSRRGVARGHLNVWITMVTCGVWHGAAWTFVIWGALHAFYLSLERLTEWPKRLGSLPGGRHVATLIIFVLVMLGWVFFRAQSLDQALAILSIMFDPAQLNAGQAVRLIGWPLLALVGLMVLRQMYFHMGLDNVSLGRMQLQPILQPAVMAALVWACVFMRGPGTAFIYFQF